MDRTFDPSGITELRSEQMKSLVVAEVPRPKVWQYTLSIIVDLVCVEPSGMPDMDAYGFISFCKFEIRVLKARVFVELFRGVCLVDLFGKSRASNDFHQMRGSSRQDWSGKTRLYLNMVF